MRQSTKRLVSLIVGVVMLFAAGVVWSALIRPAYRDSQVLKGDLEGRRSQLAKQKETVEQVKKLIQEYQGKGELEQAVSLAVPKARDEAGVLHELNYLAEFNQLGPQSAAIVASGIQQKGGQGKNSAVKPVGTLQVQMRLQGTYESFKSFLKMLETDIRLMDVRNVTIAPQGTGANLYTFDIVVVTYYQPS